MYQSPKFKSVILGPLIGKGSFSFHITASLWLMLDLFSFRMKPRKSPNQIVCNFNKGPIGYTHIVHPADLQLKGEWKGPVFSKCFALKEVDISGSHYLELDGKKKVNDNIVHSV